MKPVPADFHIEAQQCPSCGRWIQTELAEDWMESAKPIMRTYHQVNWDHKGKFFYIANKTHSPYFCSYKRS
jgi:hypothetical protein